MSTAVARDTLASIHRSEYADYSHACSAIFGNMTPVPEKSCRLSETDPLPNSPMCPVHHAQNGRVLYVFTLQGKNGRRLGIAD